MTKVAVVDYGSGNLHSVRNALEMVGADVVIAKSPDQLKESERIVLPGVGAFSECMKNLHASGLVDSLQEQVHERRKPFYGICVGMQILARRGTENGLHEGLSWLDGTVEKFDPELGLKVPHVGWNEVLKSGKGAELFDGIADDATFYFVHSYHFVSNDETLSVAKCDYGLRFNAALLRGNIFATQFHPEKSQQNGLRLLENFLKWSPQ